MDKVKVIAVQGATIRGPAVVKLSKEQYASRAHVLGAPVRGNKYHLDGNQALTFKFGEELQIEQSERLNRALFGLPSEEKAAAAPDKPGADGGRVPQSTQEDVVREQFVATAKLEWERDEELRTFYAGDFDAYLAALDEEAAAQ